MSFLAQSGTYSPEQIKIILKTSNGAADDIFKNGVQDTVFKKLV